MSALPSLPQGYELVSLFVLEDKEAPGPQGSFQTLLKLPDKNLSSINHVSFCGITIPRQVAPKHSQTMRLLLQKGH